MSVEISKSTIQKLGHESSEIRTRTLLQIKGKFIRALAHDECISFHPGELLKCLIRWFGKKPLLEEESVLELFKMVLKTERKREALEFLGTNRLRKELDKISYLLSSETSKRYLEEIKILLPVYMEAEDIEIKESESDCKVIETKLNDADFVEPWSTPSIVDYNALKSISEVLEMKQSSENMLKQALLHLKSTLNDYPAEYFLQPPHIFKSLLLLAKSRNSFIDQIIEIMLVLTKAVSSRIKQRCHPDSHQLGTDNFVNRGKSQISVPKFFSEVYEFCIDNLHLDVENTLFIGVFKIIEYLSDSRNIIAVPQKISNRLSAVVGSYRIMSTDSVLIRFQYLFLVFVLTKLKKYSILESTDELKLALFDLQILNIYNDKYKEIERFINLNEQEKLLIKCRERFIPTVKLLEATNDEHILQLSKKAMETYSIHQCLDVVKKIFKAIVNCIPYIRTNRQLRTKTADVLLYLLSHNDCKVKVFVYSETAYHVKKSFTNLLNGNRMISKTPNSDLIEECTLGLPFTADILRVIISYGCDSAEPEIRNSAQTILAFILKTRSLLDRKWIYIFEIIRPNLPLLQSLKFDVDFNSSVVSLLDPDHAQDYTSDLELIAGNSRFLFHSNAGMRSEALSRLIFILSAADALNKFKPNIIEIRDTLPNDICILTTQRVGDKIFQSSGCFDCAIVDNLLLSLECKKLEPVIKKSILMQLNVICQDRNLIQIVIDKNGWYHSLNALDNALRNDADTFEYTDTAISAVGILSKILLFDQRFRCELSRESSIYMLLIRTLFLFQTDITLQQDASLSLFLLCFCEFISGSIRLTAPKVLENLKCPLKCDFQSEMSSFRNDMEAAYNEVKDDAVFRFVRLNFADVWFGGLHKVIPQEVNYTKMFNKHLQLNEIDLAIVNSSSWIYTFRKFFAGISNAISHSDVIWNISGIRLCLLMKPSQSQVNDEEAIAVLRKFILIPPRNEMDVLLCENIVDVFISFTDTDCHGVTSWIWTSTKNKQNIILSILRNYEDIPITLYEKIGLLLEKLIVTINHEGETDFLIDLVEYLVPTIEECFHKRSLDCVRCLLGLIEVLCRCQQLELSAEYIFIISKKLLYFTIALKSSTQIGSAIEKKCLFIIASLMTRVQDFCFNETYLKYLSGLCGHQDFEIRALAWCLLENMSKSNKTSKRLEKALQFLPGGFGACCLSTLFDRNEVPLVKSLAGNVVANCIPFDEDLLQKFDFFEVVYLSLDDFLSEEVIPDSSMHQRFTTPIMVCAYCKILSNIVVTSKIIVPDELLIKLSALVKTPMKKSNALVEMDMEICSFLLRIVSKKAEMYNNFTQNLARDQYFIEALIKLLRKEHTRDCIKDILRLLMELTRDSLAFQFMCEYLLSQSSNDCMEFLISSSECTVFSDLRQMTMAFCTYFLVKSQCTTYKHATFSDVLNTTATAEALFLQMEKLFMDHFNTKSHKFEDTPSSLIVAVCELIAMLLSASDKVRTVAKKNMFLDHVFAPITNFFENFQSTYTTFVRRYGESKKEPIIRQFILLFRIILNLHSADVLDNPVEAQALSRIVTQTWPWMAHSAELKRILLRTLLFLSATSIHICRQISMTISGHSHSILEMVMKFVILETNKKGHSSDHSWIDVGLSIMINCCACHEGRSLLLKLNCLDVFNRFYPIDYRSKSLSVVCLWLEFWEVLSRYPEGASCKHLILISTLIKKSNPPIRWVCLKILRNMSFAACNRLQLLDSSDFLYTLEDLLNNGTAEEKCIVCVSIWSLCACTSKAKSIVKSSSIGKELKRTHHDTAISSVNDELKRLVDIVIDILYQ